MNIRQLNKRLRLAGYNEVPVNCVLRQRAAQERGAQMQW